MLSVFLFALKDLGFDLLRTLFSAAGMAAVTMGALLLNAFSSSMGTYIYAAPTSSNLLVVDSTTVDPSDSDISPAVLQAAYDLGPELIGRVSPQFFRRLWVSEKLVQVRAAPPEDWPSVYHMSLLQGTWPSGAGQAMVGEGAAAGNHWQIGSVLDVAGNALTVTAIYRAPGASFSAIWLPLEQAQAIFGTERGIQCLALQLTAAADPEEVRRRLQADPRLTNGMAVFFEDAYTHNNIQFLRDVYGLMFAVSIIALLTVALGTYSLTALNLAERAHQIGILRAVGFSYFQLRLFLTLRALLLAGLAFGVGLAVALVYVQIQQTGGPVYINGFPFTFYLGGEQIGLCMGLTLGFALSGAWLSTRWMLNDSVAQLVRI
jgi:hypothetical protein